MKELASIALSIALALTGLTAPEAPAEVPSVPLEPAEQVQEYVYHKQVPILMYHEVNDALTNDLYLSVAHFKSHLDYFDKKGITPITMEQLYLHWTQKLPLPDKPIVLTFDDGYRSMYETVYPLLKEKGWPGTFYCITDTRWSKGFVSEDMIREMAHNGMEIGSHTMSHTEVTSMKQAVLEQELSESKVILEGLTGYEVPHFCYPVGKNNKAAQKVLADNGYHCAVTTQHGFAQESQGMYTLKRLRISRGCSANTLANMLAPLGY